MPHHTVTGSLAAWATTAEDVGREFVTHEMQAGRNPHYALFRQQDLLAWIIFTVVFTVLIAFDNFVLHRKAEKLSFKQSMLYTVMWIAIAGVFCIYIFFSRGLQASLDWSTGYLLEWMLSVDNLFVFHLIFQKFGTPDELKHKPLFYGIVGAIVFRMMFFCVGELLIHKIWWMHIIFGLFLVYTGIQTVLSDDEDEDPRDNPVLKMISQRFTFLNGYDMKGNFFVHGQVDPKTGMLSFPKLRDAKLQDEDEAEAISEAAQEAGYGAPVQGQQATDANAIPVGERRATLLVLVVICLEVTDVVFAVDSVSAIVAQIPDLYLAYTACVFAMLGLRAMFFVIDELVKLFSLLKYGVALILMFIGVKLCVKSWITFSPMLVSFILLGAIFTSIAASVIVEKVWPSKDDEE